jgi:hypothetical protein
VELLVGPLQQEREQQLLPLSCLDTVHLQRRADYGQLYETWVPRLRPRHGAWLP